MSGFLCACCHSCWPILPALGQRVCILVPVFIASGHFHENLKGQVLDIFADSVTLLKHHANFSKRIS